MLILDDWSITPFTAEQRRDLLEIDDDRYGRAATSNAATGPAAANWCKFDSVGLHSVGTGELLCLDKGFVAEELSQIRPPVQLLSLRIPGQK